jgi:hypothetical protein
MNVPNGKITSYGIAIKLFDVFCHVFCKKYKLWIPTILTNEAYYRKNVSLILAVRLYLLRKYLPVSTVLCHWAVDGGNAVLQQHQHEYWAGSGQQGCNVGGEWSGAPARG